MSLRALARLRPSLGAPLRAHLRAPALPVLAARRYASLSPDAPPPTRPYDVFDEEGKARQRDRAVIRLREATETGDIPGPEVLDYLREEVADRLAERVEVRYCPTSQAIRATCS